MNGRLRTFNAFVFFGIEIKTKIKTKIVAKSVDFAFVMLAHNGFLYSNEFQATETEHKAVLTILLHKKHTDETKPTEGNM